MAWNPRFVAYAAAHGRTPEAQSDHDRQEWPGGMMVGFMLWMSDRQRDFLAAHPEAFFVGWNGRRSEIQDFAAWDAFLSGQAAK